MKNLPFLDLIDAEDIIVRPADFYDVGRLMTELLSGDLEPAPVVGMFNDVGRALEEGRLFLAERGAYLVGLLSLREDRVDVLYVQPDLDQLRVAHALFAEAEVQCVANGIETLSVGWDVHPLLVAVLGARGYHATRIGEPDSYQMARWTRNLASASDSYVARWTRDLASARYRGLKPVPS